MSRPKNDVGTSRRIAGTHGESRVESRQFCLGPRCPAGPESIARCCSLSWEGQRWPAWGRAWLSARCLHFKLQPRNRIKLRVTLLAILK